MQNESRLVIAMYAVAFLNGVLSLIYIKTEPYLSAVFFSGIFFFIFLSKNPNLLNCKSLDEIDHLLPVLEGKSYCWGAYIVLGLNLLYLYFN